MGTSKGGKKAAKTNKERHGANFYAEIGRRGGLARKVAKGFASDIVGADGLTGRQRASIAGRKGGFISRRGKKKEATK